MLMKRSCAALVALVLLLVTPGLASAYPQRSPANQQAINQVIARALTQRGVPFTYGGGDATGPTRGLPEPTEAAADDPAAAALPPVPGLILAPPQPVAPAPVPAPAPQPQSTVAGFDASGIIVYAFAGVGIKVPRSSGEQYRVSQKVAPAQALPGDLIFYGPDGSQSVALFLGNGQMLEATPPAVAVSPVRTNGMTPYLGRIIL